MWRAGRPSRGSTLLTESLSWLKPVILPKLLLKESGMRLFVAALIALSMSSAAEAAFYPGPLVAVFSEASDGLGPRLAYFDARCAEGEREGCGAAALTCVAPATVGIDLDSVSSSTLSAWLSKADRPALTLSSGGKSSAFHLFSMGANEIDGGWYVKFDSYGSGDVLSPSEWLKTFAATPDISVTTPDADLTILPSMGADGDALQAFLRACEAF
jgi:hypothetical protein